MSQDSLANLPASPIKLKILLLHFMVLDACPQSDQAFVRAEAHRSSLVRKLGHPDPVI
jgi:hypothetical protein